MVKKFLMNKLFVIFVDIKKKEFVGNYKNNGWEWIKKGKSKEVNGYDFLDLDVFKVVLYGIYDIGDNIGWVNVGINVDIFEFVVGSIKYWWKKIGIKKYFKVKKILICVDVGGSNVYCFYLWKKEL